MTTPDPIPARVSVIRFTPASPFDRMTGLLGYLVLEIGSLVRVRDATLRRSRNGRTYICFPDRVDGRGKRRGLLAPIDGAARDAIDAAVLEQLAREGLLPLLGLPIVGDAAPQSPLQADRATTAASSSADARPEATP